MPRGDEDRRALRELFEHPEQWEKTRANIDVLAYTDLNLKHDFKDDELRCWFLKMKEGKLKLAMEVGTLKSWGTTGEKTFTAERKNWEHLQSLGADLYAIALDEPLCCGRDSLRMPDEYALARNG